MYHRKNGRNVLNPNIIAPITPEIKIPKALLGLVIKRLLFIRYHKLNSISKTEINEKNEKEKYIVFSCGYKDKLISIILLR